MTPKYLVLDWIQPNYGSSKNQMRGVSYVCLTYQQSDDIIMELEELKRREFKS